MLDTDERWLDYISGAARDEGIALETVTHDLRQPLPEAMRGAFDTVETDPPYTICVRFWFCMVFRTRNTRCSGTWA